MIFEASGFDWDEGNRTKCLKHGLTIEAIEAAFGETFAVMPDRSGSSESRSTSSREAEDGMSSLFLH